MATHINYEKADGWEKDCPQSYAKVWKKYFYLLDVVPTSDLLNHGLLWTIMTIFVAVVSCTIFRNNSWNNIWHDDMGLCRKSKALDALDEIGSEHSPRSHMGQKSRGKENKPWEPPSYQKKSSLSPELSRKSPKMMLEDTDDSDDMMGRRKSRPKSPSEWNTFNPFGKMEVIRSLDHDPRDCQNAHAATCNFLEYVVND